MEKPRIPPPDPARWCICRRGETPIVVDEDWLRNAAIDGSLVTYDAIWNPTVDPACRRWHNFSHLSFLPPHPPSGLYSVSAPFVQILATSDDLCCDTCRQMHKRVYRCNEDVPLLPFHLECRCLRSSIPYTEAIRNGWADYGAEGKGIILLKHSDDLVPNVYSLRTAPPKMVTAFCAIPGLAEALEKARAARGDFP